MIDLKTCPICGCTSYFYTSKEGRRQSYTTKPAPYSVHCSKNCVSTRDYQSQEEAAAVWNVRANETIK